MKKATLLALALAIPATVIAADKDSVYAWGAWSQNIQPAAGPRIEVAPAAVSQPQVNFRPNENAAFNRVANTPAAVTPPPVTPPPAIPTPTVVEVDIDAPVIAPGDLPETTPFSLKSRR
ncbi:MAG TPA: hypothetical protein VIQ81_05810 [Gammaproteobacteria bacterium]